MYTSRYEELDGQHGLFKKCSWPGKEAPEVAKHRILTKGLEPPASTHKEESDGYKRNDIDKIVFSPEVYQVELEIEGKKAKGIIRELQQHPIKDTIQHVDFLELSETKPVRVGLPVRLTGSSRGVMAGGKLMQVFRRLTVVALPQDIPDAITLDISKLKIGKSIRVGSIEIPGVKFLDPANAVVVSVKMARGAIKPADDDDDEDEEA